jgi:transposase
MDDVRLCLSDEVWERIAKALYAVKHPAGAPPDLSDRDFVEAVLYIARAGHPWRDLPLCFGDWNAVYQRFRRWEKAGYWQAVFAIVPGYLDAVERLLFDSTIVRAHPQAAGASQKKAARKRKAWVAVAADSPRNCTLPRRMKARRLQFC